VRRLRRDRSEADCERRATASAPDGSDALPSLKRCAWRTSTAVLFWLSGAILPASAQDQSVTALVRAYPDFLADHDEKDLIWKDGTRMPLSDGLGDKSFEEKLRRASLLDQLSTPYPKGPMKKQSGPQEDPGRFRNAAFFDKMYGDCSKGEVQKKLTKVPWLPKSGGGSVQITSVNGVADRLRAISAELDALRPELKKFAVPSAGAFNCRTVEDTGVRSMHAWGAAIDANTELADYWLWSPKGSGYRNRLPFEIVRIFENYRFIWGGKWEHFDTMHFEYRPELLD
jgi:D-alanyl-D-alanine carboxypeptidase-like protein